MDMERSIIEAWLVENYWQLRRTVCLDIIAAGLYIWGYQAEISVPPSRLNHQIKNNRTLLSFISSLSCLY